LAKRAQILSSQKILERADLPLAPLLVGVAVQPVVVQLNTADQAVEVSQVRYQPSSLAKEVPEELADTPLVIGIQQAVVEVLVA
jgi:hypothetical protein